MQVGQRVTGEDHYYHPRWNQSWWLRLVQAAPLVPFCIFAAITSGFHPLVMALVFTGCGLLYAFVRHTNTTTVLEVTAHGVSFSARGWNLTSTWEGVDHIEHQGSRADLVLRDEETWKPQRWYARVFSVPSPRTTIPLRGWYGEWWDAGVYDDIRRYAPWLIDGQA